MEIFYNVWASNHLRDCEQDHDVHLVWVLEGQGMKYLGIEVGFHLRALRQILTRSCCLSKES